MKKKRAIGDELYHRIKDALERDLEDENREAGFDALVNRVATQCRVSVDDVLHAVMRRGSEAVARQLRAIAEAKRHILPAARGLAKARRVYRHRGDFNRWLATSPYGELTRTERNCLLKLAQHERLTALVLCRDDLQFEVFSLPDIWREVRALVQLEDL